MTSSKSHPYWTTLFAVILFACAMGYLEAAVVVYLRELFYPQGFSFPFKLISGRLIVIELFRELSTVIMLASVSILAGRKFWERFGYFIIMFGVWDIFYYIWLKATINWPSSLFEWDILFLIPLPWIGPVIAPVLVALLMIVIGISLTYLLNKGHTFKPTVVTWVLAVIATVVIMYSFMYDVEAVLHQVMPKPYRYELLLIGIFLYGTAYYNSYRRSKSQ